MTAICDLQVGLPAEVGQRLKDVGMSMKVWQLGDDVFVALSDAGHEFARLKAGADTLRDTRRSPVSILANIVESLVLLRLAVDP